MKNRLLELLQENCRYSNEELAAMADRKITIIDGKNTE